MTRPSRKYIDGVGKPVVKKRYDDVIGKHLWSVVFPPCNNFGTRFNEPEAIACGRAQAWCDKMNHRIYESDRIRRSMKGNK